MTSIACWHAGEKTPCINGSTLTLSDFMSKQLTVLLLFCLSLLRGTTLCLVFMCHNRCDPYTNWLLTGEDMDCCCHSNLTRAVAEFGLTEEDVHDVLNVFMCTGFTRDTNQYFTKPSPVRKGDYIEFLGECLSSLQSDRMQNLKCAYCTSCPGACPSMPRRVWHDTAW